MNNVVVLCALVAAAAVAAYDFEDPDFNILLSDNFEELSDDLSSYSHPRSRRDDEAVKDEKEKCRPHKRWEGLCCAAETVEKIRDGDKAVKKACFKEIVPKDKPEKFDPFSCESMEQRKKQIMCVMQCVGQKMNVLDSNGSPKEEEFSAMVKESFSPESWLAPLQDNVISTCLDEARNATANRDASDSSSCNPAGARLSHCLYREIQLNCPAEEIKDERSCARLRERIKGRDFFQLAPPPPPGVMGGPDN